MSFLRGRAVPSFGFLMSLVSAKGATARFGSAVSTCSFFLGTKGAISKLSKSIADPDHGAGSQTRQYNEREPFHKPLATVHTQTSFAPPFSKVLAHSLVVAPVVKTSSTNTMRFSSSRAVGRNLKAPRTFCARFGLVNMVCV